LKGVIVGGIADVVLTYVLAIVIVTIPILMRLSANASKSGDSASIVAAGVSGPMIALLLCVGGACSVLGGYVSARLAEHDELLNGALSAWLCVGVGLLTMRSSISPPWERVVTDVSAPVFGLLGGYMYVLQRGKTKSESIGVGGETP
jgi:hypothetical protein